MHVTVFLKSCCHAGERKLIVGGIYTQSTPLHIPLPSSFLCNRRSRNSRLYTAPNRLRFEQSISTSIHLTSFQSAHLCSTKDHLSYLSLRRTCRRNPQQWPRTIQHKIRRSLEEKKLPYFLQLTFAILLHRVRLRLRPISHSELKAHYCHLDCDVPTFPQRPIRSDVVIIGEARIRPGNLPFKRGKLPL